MNQVRAPFIAAAAVALLAFVASKADAQTVPAWDQDRVSWSAPTQCVSGEPLTKCPITGYRIEEAASATATAAWGLVKTVTPDVLFVLIIDRTSGNHCYRVRAESKTPSVWSGVACKKTVAPQAGPVTLNPIDAPGP